MNLIERLGGYEAAKANIRELASDYDEGVTGKTKLYDFPFNVGQVEQALLEYRRQHNIFEVGDLVVNDAFINSHVYVFKKLLPDISMALIAYDDDEGACGLYSLRHATDAEIKAGRRL